MMIERALDFVRKPWADKSITIRYFFRRAIARLPYLPIPIWIRVSPQTELCFWWSKVVADFNPDRKFFDYWDRDGGDLAFLWRFLEPGMVFLDVGAYHGTYSVIAGKKLVQPNSIFAFEPSPRDRLRLTLHLRMNGIHSVCTVPFAVSSSSGQLRFFQVKSDETTMNSLRRPPTTSAVREISVPAICLDDFAKERPGLRVDVMKIDVEGGELEVFKGGREFFGAHRPIILCEVLDRVTSAWGYPAREIVATLEGKGYQWYSFRPDGTLFPHVIQSHYPDVKNYLAVPIEKNSLVENYEHGQEPNSEGMH
jgi:FkbM family methyltransferase